ncbi:MAG TPA: DUF4239 domain-containing protein [Vicinamibacterales bacterium]|nr:DUF4239 domain-containing protein [Vicinamibacterales bacterium]
MPINMLGLGYILGSIVATVGALWVARRTLSMERLKRSHDLTVFCGTIAGTIYAVILAFILFAAWNDFTSAQTVVTDETVALANLAYVGRGLPVAIRGPFEADTIEYARLVINDEWPQMANGGSSHRVRRVLMDMGLLVLKARSEPDADTLVLDHTITGLAQLQAMRQTRLLQSQSALPAILWLVLIAGAVVTLVFSLLIATGDFAMHAVHTVLLAALLALVLVAIQDIKSPFQGVVHVDASEMQKTLRALEQPPQP